MSSDGVEAQRSLDLLGQSLSPVEDAATEHDLHVGARTDLAYRVDQDADVRSILADEENNRVRRASTRLFLEDSSRRCRHRRNRRRIHEPR